MTPRLFVRVLLHGALALLALGAGPSEARSSHPSPVDQILSLPEGPFAIGHRGFGENLGEDPSRPIENTVRAVRRAFKAGISVVEVDVQLTRDHRVVAYHDDFLPDLTCLNRLTFGELRRRLPHVPSLHEVLNEVKQFTRSSGPLQGVVIIELKAAAPMCDPDDRQERAIVFSVTTAIRLMGMTRQVMLTSFSPSLLYLASVGAPELTRILSISGLQFLTAAEVEAMLGLPVTLIEKRLDLGLQWAEIGPIFRLPGYQSLADVLSTAAIVRARVVEADLFLLSALGTSLVEALHASGLKVFGFTANNEAEWSFLESLGVDGIYTNDVPLGVENQASIP